MKQRLVVGFVFNLDRKVLLLVKKQSPAWQHGRLNGIGGKANPGESPIAAMRREAYEEAGLSNHVWTKVAVLTDPDHVVYFFFTTSDDHVLHAVPSRNDVGEHHLLVNPRALPATVIPNLQWLVPLCLTWHRSLNGNKMTRVEITEIVAERP